MDSLVSSQTLLLARMSRAVDNLKKLGKAKITKGVVQAKLTYLDSVWQQFHAQDEKIRALASETSYTGDYFTQDVFAQGEDIFCVQRGLLLDFSDGLSPPGPPSSQGPTLQVTEHRPRSSLPRIELPTFSGAFTEWIRFRDLFSSLVLNESSWTDAERFHYLMASLTGEAALLIKRVPLAASNFTKAWELLQHRFENRRLLIVAQFDALYSIKPVAAHTAEELKRVLNHTCNVVAALEGLDTPIDEKAYWIVHHTSRLLDRETAKEWEASLGGRIDPPKFSELTDFLEGQIRTLEAFESRHGFSPDPEPRHPRTTLTKPTPPVRKAKTVHTTVGKKTRTRCFLCQGDHLLCFCEAFRAKPAPERKQTIISKQLCFNCLGPHDVTTCPSPKLCQRCAEKHHTMLHDVMGQPSIASTAMHISQTTSTNIDRPIAVLLATARVVVNAEDRTITVRTLIDPCSEVSLVTESLVQLLRLPRKPATQTVIGAGAKVTATTRGKVVLNLSSCTDAAASCQLEALILPKLSAYRPRCSVMSPQWPHLEGLTLADPQFASAEAVQILLGADVFPRVLQEGLRPGGPHAPVAQRTIFGWILSGPTSSMASAHADTVGSHTCSVDDDLERLLTRFWEQEAVPPAVNLGTEEDQHCEAFYRATVQRCDDGRYMVRLPFKPNPAPLGESFPTAKRIFLGLERRFKNNRDLHREYAAFMTEYMQLGHMQLVPPSQRIPHQEHFYLPHHGVLKESSTTTKLRVVFNGSRRTSTGTSLNEQLCTGPKLQNDLLDILLRWRRHPVAFIADIEKMYRQIQVHPADWDLQRILWRDSAESPIQPYHLTTVTYGLSCAPYLAIRTLHQLAEDEECRYPAGAQVLRRDTYVDDILSGADNADIARTVQLEVINLCRAGGFTPRKWCSNDPTLLDHLDAAMRADLSIIPWQPELGCSALGLTWHPRSDELSFTIQASEHKSPVTKRLILSQVAKLFDPLGWLAPVIIQAKLLMQELWRDKYDWDSPLPHDVVDRWLRFTDSLAELRNLRIPRWLQTGPSTCSIQWHAFADASERAYAAVIYLRTTSHTGATQVTLVASKSKVAPIKQVTLPRLELCAIQLAAQLLHHIRTISAIQSDSVHVWSDSTIALAWIRGSPAQWHTYVANRVSEIQTSLPDADFHHVRSKDNPADGASRGISVDHLVDDTVWWHGPRWLTKDPSEWPTNQSCDLTTNAEARITCHIAQVKTAKPPELLLRYSSLTRLLHVTAWCLRWQHIRKQETSSLPADRRTLHPDELRQAEIIWIRVVQKLDFHEELQALSNQRPIPRHSRLLRLTPILDPQGLLRVGGRLANASLHYDELHPIILPPDSYLTELIIDDHHQRTLHGGTQMTLASIRQRFWILRGRQRVKHWITLCTRCVRWRAITATQRMGDLPMQRVTPSRPFLHSGVDYAGPLQIKDRQGRGCKLHKGYIAVFVCFSTRAVHLEAVSDYTTDAFIAAFKRFTGRRGLCATLTSDRGTNFVGADAELRRLWNAAINESSIIARDLAKTGTLWKFNPPGAPHFGGLWEAAVKATKRHLRRVLNDTPVTFEELTTLLCQVEACLNSRPLHPLSDDPADLNPLTPGHFLTGGPLICVPEPTLADLSVSRLSRWQMLQQKLEHFWSRWRREYLHYLQNRNKWTDLQPPIQVGDLCLITTETTPPSRWPLARVVQVHPGEDNLVRVVTLKTASGIFQRPITKLVPLPRDSDRRPDVTVTATTIRRHPKAGGML